MSKLRIAVIDLIPQGPASSLWARVMNANMASIMPTVVAAWCEQAGHKVTFFLYTGFEDLLEALPVDCDLVFVSAFTRSAQLSYAVSSICRKRGAVTVLGGPHARCYPDDAALYFDYVLGFTDRQIIMDVLQDCTQHRPAGLHLSAKQQPAVLPSLAERWKFIEPTLAKAPIFKLVPLVASLGCPYRCSFCIDAEVKFTPLSLDQLREDLRFLLTKIKRPRVGWQDPNFGIRFDEIMDAIEEAVPPGSIDHIAETSLSILSESRLQRLQRIGFKGLLPGIESWYEAGEKSRTGKRIGEEKVSYVAEVVNTMQRYIPFVQVNFVLGLDTDRGKEPFELTKKFLDLCPGSFPAYSLLTAFGEAVPMNLTLQRAGRVLPFPFYFLDNNKSMNVRPAHYSWTEFYDYLVDLMAYSFSWRSIRRRFAAQGPRLDGWVNVIRAISSEGFGRLKYHRTIRERLDTDEHMRRFIEGDTVEIPEFYREHVRRKLGPFWEFLPEGALSHDSNAYLKKQQKACNQTGADATNREFS